MLEQSAEQVAHLRARAVIDNDFGTTLRLMTHDGFAKSMEIGLTNWDYESYELIAKSRDGDDYIFDITYGGNDDPVTLRDHFRLIDGEWRIVDVERIG